MTSWVKWLLGAALLAGLVYLYYTEVKPVVIFGFGRNMRMRSRFRRFRKD